ncbi:hypothetical protein P280DRAFT_85746 [Massarina eburnea CBS 473.64]|uniref:Uncharacterized protein n=1 Tax=Massarina eburnea CBS 473.64 TaxID=1395130 RepID=A0A6A6RR26_9PLEO|nr:hypothetical protein P280DRAFT_85746 [Massarina eburnea CBS 473.64]
MKLPFALLATVLVWNVLALVAPRSKLVPRFDEDDVASNELWQRVTCKGGRLIAAMLGSDEDAGKLIDDKRTPSSASSVWQGDLKSELSKWKWFDIPTDDPDEQERGNHDGYWHVESAIEALRLNGKPGSDNVVYTVQHSNPELMDSVGHHAPVASQTYDVDGEKYTATGASYEFVINYKGGVIYAQDILSPMHGARQEWYREPQHKELPHLNKFSDVLWGYWVRDNANIKNIKYFWVEGVVNIDTNSIIATALKAAGKTLAVWPGTTFDMNTEAGKAILGSDNGASFAWFLIQRKAQLGNKWISKVTVFYSDEDFSGNDPHLLFHVEDTPPLQSGKKASSVLRARGRGQGLVDKVPPIEQQSPRNFRRVHVFNSASYLGSSRGGSNAFVG